MAALVELPGDSTFYQEERGMPASKMRIFCQIMFILTCTIIFTLGSAGVSLWLFTHFLKDDVKTLAWIFLAWFVVFTLFSLGLLIFMIALYRRAQVVHLPKPIDEPVTPTPLRDLVSRSYILEHQEMPSSTSLPTPPVFSRHDTHTSNSNHDYDYDNKSEHHLDKEGHYTRHSLGNVSDAMWANYLTRTSGLNNAHVPATNPFAHHPDPLGSCPNLAELVHARGAQSESALTDFSGSSKGSRDTKFSRTTQGTQYTSEDMESVFPVPRLRFAEATACLNMEEGKF